MLFGSRWKAARLAILFAWALGILPLSVFEAALRPTLAAPLRNALVIGNAQYANHPLPNAVNDAREMAAQLRALGFDVTLLENGTNAAMRSAVVAFARDLEKGGTGLFYYAGHGLQIGGSDHLLPLGSDPGSVASVKSGMIALAEVVEAVSKPRPDRLNIVILDMCRNGPASGAPIGQPGNTRPRDPDLFIARATAPGSVAFDTDAGSGLFTRALLQEIAATGEFSAQRTFAPVRAAVAERTGYAQLPELTAPANRGFRFLAPAPEHGRLEARLVSVQPFGLTTTRGVQRALNPDESFWATIKESRNPADYDAYLRHFPDGLYAGTARERLRKYRAPPPQPKEPSAPPAPAEIEDLDAYFTARRDANVRARPSTSAKQIGTLSAGERFRVTGKVKGMDWYRLETDSGQPGFVFGGLVAVDSEEATAPADPQGTAPAEPQATAPAGPQAHVEAAAAWELFTPFEAGSFEMRNLEQFADEISAATNGAFKIVVLGAPSMKGVDIWQAVSAGRAPAGSFLLSDLGGRNPLFEVDLVPFLATNYGEAQALWDASRPFLQPLLEADGLRFVFVIAHAPRGLFANRQIWKMDDIKTMRIASEHPMMARFATLAGASPVETPAANLPQAFSAKRIDGAFASMPTGVAEKLWTVVPAFFDLAIALPKSVVVFNGAAYHALAPEIQTAMLNATVAAQNRGWQTSVIANNEGIDQLRSKGMTVGVVPPEVLDTLKKFGTTIERDWVQRAGAEGKAMLDDYRRTRTTSAQ